ncbi:MAG TPA: CoB--CoM heterodisulfide reductase subunit C [Euryarchaeota archaeon]|nr:CoB--CoM heterodisulfide reductase subunit C [Euryarchaeota archaeon]
MTTDAKQPNPEFAKKVVEAGGKTLNLCFQCGTCTGSCPSGRQTAFRTRKLVRRAQLGLKDDIMGSDDLWLCTTCFTCYERCPRGVEIVDIIMALRNMSVREGHMAPQHKKIAQLVSKSGHLVNLRDEDKAFRKKLGLRETPPTVLEKPAGLEQVKKICQITGFDKLVAGD